MKNILVVIDVQNDFIYGKFSTKQAQNIISPIFQEIKSNTIPYDIIIFTRDTHEKRDFDDINYYEQLSFEGSHFDEHCTCPADRELAYPISKFVAQANATNIIKGSFDGSKKIESSLYELYPTEREGFHYYLCGVCTDICVLATAIGLTKDRLAKKITVLTDLCAGTSPKAHKTAIAALKSFGINTITIKQLKKRSKK